MNKIYMERILVEEFIFAHNEIILSGPIKFQGHLKVTLMKTTNLSNRG